jgi:hypothetical protein
MLHLNPLWNELIQIPTLEYIDLSGCQQINDGFKHSLVKGFHTPFRIRSDSNVYSSLKWTLKETLAIIRMQRISFYLSNKEQHEEETLAFRAQKIAR